jgi:outer membrane lipoprotein SlyB
MSPAAIKKREEAEARLVTATVGAGMLGAAVGSAPGALVGGVVGAILAILRNKEIKKKKPYHGR